MTSCSTSTSIQTLIFRRSVFHSQRTIRNFLRRNGFKTKLDCSEKTCRARQVDPGRFCRGTFRTIPLRKKGAGGVMAVVGKRRST